jgi:hypothetical protein
MAGNDEDRDRSRRPGTEDRGCQAQIGYSVTERSRYRVTLCVDCTVHKEMRSAGFLVEPQNQGRRFISGLGSKPLRWFVSCLTSKLLERFVSGLTSKSLERFISDFTSNSLGRFLSV